MTLVRSLAPLLLAVLLLPWPARADGPPSLLEAETDALLREVDAAKVSQRRLALVRVLSSEWTDGGFVSEVELLRPAPSPSTPYSESDGAWLPALGVLNLALGDGPHPVGRAPGRLALIPTSLTVPVEGLLPTGSRLALWLRPSRGAFVQDVVVIDEVLAAQGVAPVPLAEDGWYPDLGPVLSRLRFPDDRDLRCRLWSKAVSDAQRAGHEPDEAAASILADCAGKTDLRSRRERILRRLQTQARAAHGQQLEDVVGLGLLLDSWGASEDGARLLLRVRKTVGSAPGIDRATAAALLRADDAPNALAVARSHLERGDGRFLTLCAALAHSVPDALAYCPQAEPGATPAPRDPDASDPRAGSEVKGPELDQAVDGQLITRVRIRSVADPDGGLLTTFEVEVRPDEPCALVFGINPPGASWLSVTMTLVEDGLWRGRLRLPKAGKSYYFVQVREAESGRPIESLGTPDSPLPVQLRP